jgi:hypothetical protein
MMEEVMRFLAWTLIDGIRRKPDLLFLGIMSVVNRMCAMLQSLGVFLRKLSGL